MSSDEEYSSDDGSNASSAGDASAVADASAAADVITVASAASNGSTSSSSVEYCFQCSPITPETFAGIKLSARGKCCQVCYFEGRGIVQKNVVVCKAHKVRVCADVAVNTPHMYEYLYKKKLLLPDTMEWFCQTKDATCWDKLHNYYAPNGLFPTLTQGKKCERKG